MIFFISFIVFANAYILIKQLTIIAFNSTFVDASEYAYGNVLRNNPNFNDIIIINLIPSNGRSTGNEILSTDFICMPSQQEQIQTDDNPQLRAAVANAITLRYQENGHITLSKN